MEALTFIRTEISFFFVQYIDSGTARESDVLSNCESEGNVIIIIRY